MKGTPRVLMCPICRRSVVEETVFPWFVRLGVVGCEQGHKFTFMMLETDFVKPESLKNEN